MEINSGFARLENLIGISNLNKLKNSTVLIVGIGGVGGYVCESLARSFVGTIIIVDNDLIDYTNINRQIIATNDVIGLKKVDVMKKRIEAINSECHVITYDLFLDENTISNIKFDNIDFIVDCCDTVKTKELLIKKSVEFNISFISSMGTANKFDPTKLFITTLDKTFNDPLARILRKYVRDQHISRKIMVVSSTEVITNNKGVSASSIFVPSIAGLLIGNYVFKTILK